MFNVHWQYLFSKLVYLTFVDQKPYAHFAKSTHIVYFLLQTTHLLCAVIIIILQTLVQYINTIMQYAQLQVIKIPISLKKFHDFMAVFTVSIYFCKGNKFQWYNTAFSPIQYVLYIYLVCVRISNGENLCSTKNKIQTLAEQ